MAKKQRKASRWSDKAEARARRLRRFTIGCGALTALAFVVLVASKFVRLEHEHKHPAAPHGGQVVPVGEGDAHYHAEVVIEPTGVVRLYPLGAELTESVAIDPQFVVVKAGPAGAPADHEFVLRPAPGEVAADGRATAFIGRLPGDAVAERIVVRVPALRIRGEEFGFEVTWESGKTREEMLAAYETEQRRIYLEPGGKYTEADIAASGRTTAATKYRGHRLGHGPAAQRGDRVCPVTGFKATDAVGWRVAGEGYLFCCQPCIDEFVLLAKERPGEVRRPADYVK